MVFLRNLIRRHRDSAASFHWPALPPNRIDHRLNHVSILAPYSALGGRGMILHILTREIVDELIGAGDCPFAIGL